MKENCYKTCGYCDGTTTTTSTTTTSDCGLTVEDARAACIAFASGWSVKKEGPGSLICTDGAVASANCASIDKWRAVVWKNGYGDPYDTDNEGKFSTQAGYYYGGHDPCQYGDNLGAGYSWNNCAEEPTTTPPGG